jgi:hypothetical protein
MAYEQCNTHIVAILRLLGCHHPRGFAMHTQEVVPVAEGGRWRDRRPVGYSATPAVVFDSTGREIATFRSPRKLGKAIVSGELVLLAGDTIVVGKAPMVVS